MKQEIKIEIPFDINGIPHGKVMQCFTNPENVLETIYQLHREDGFTHKQAKKIALNTFMQVQEKLYQDACKIVALRNV